MTIEQIKKEIDEHIKSGRLKYKANSESLYYDLSIMDNQKWFKLEFLEQNTIINKYINCYIINSKKGIGKTYQMRQKMKQAEQEGYKFIFVRRLENDLKQQKEDWADLAAVSDWEYLIFGNKIINKNTGETVGITTTISTLYNQTGKEFIGYKYIFFDEFKDKRGIKRYITGEFKQFCKFITDFQRNKKDIKIYMFSNDETKHDPYTTGLRLDSDTDYFIDPVAGFFYINLKDKFKGAINDSSVGYRLGMYDDSLINEFNTNKTVYWDENNIISYQKGTIDIVKFYFYLNKKLYAYGFNNENKLIIIKSIDENKKQSGIINYALTSLDFTNQANINRPSDLKGLISSWYNQLSKGILKFVDYDDKIEIENFIIRVLGLISK